MAGREVNQDTANQVVNESLGLSMDDLGGNAHEEAFTDDQHEADDLGSDNSSGSNVGNDNDFDSDPQPQQRFQPEPEPDFLAAPQQQPNQQQLPRQSEVRPDNKGNLVDKKTGQIVAKAGAEARMYQSLHRTRQAHQALQTEHSDTVARLNKAVEIGTQMFERLQKMQTEQTELSPTRYNLSNQEAIEAMNFAKEAKVDPVGTIKKLLTRAASNGIDLQSIGLAGGNFDPKSLMDLVRGEITQHMQPLRERQQQETAQQQREREENESLEASKTELNTFLTKNPEARAYLPAFQKVYERPEFQNMSLGEVWSRIQLNLLRRGQDPSQQQRPANQQQRRQQPRMPNGRQRQPQGRQQQNAMAPVSASYEDIVRDLTKNL